MCVCACVILIVVYKSIILEWKESLKHETIRVKRELYFYYIINVHPLRQN